MDPTKKLYVAYEPISVNVAITNRAGRDIVLASRGTPWLSFSVTDSNGNLVAPSAATSFEPVMIPAGQMLSRQITVNAMYPMGQKGIYRVSASVYFPQLDRYFQSQPTAIQVSDGRELWRQVVGVPEGREGEGTYRRFTLLSFNTGSERLLYVRVQDDHTGGVFATFSLGQFIAVRDPEWTIDGQNCLHVLQLGAPELMPTPSSTSMARWFPKGLPRGRRASAARSNGDGRDRGRRRGLGGRGRPQSTWADDPHDFRETRRPAGWQDLNPATWRIIATVTPSTSTRGDWAFLGRWRRFLAKFLVRRRAQGCFH